MTKEIAYVTEAFYGYKILLTSPLHASKATLELVSPRTSPIKWHRLRFLSEYRSNFESDIFPDELLLLSITKDG